MRMGHITAQVVVAGGGVAGCAAAIAAARLGCDTVLVDRFGFLGGMFTGGNMVVLNSPPTAGIGREIMAALEATGDARRCPNDPPNYPIFHYRSEYSTMNVVYDAEAAKLVLHRMLRAAGVRLLLHSFITGAVAERDTVRGIVVANKSGQQIVEGQLVIDATADADVAASAGAAFRKGQTEQGILFAMTMLVRLSHVHWPSISEYSTTDPGLDRAIAAAIKRGELPYYKPRARAMTNYWGHPRPELSHLVYDDEALLWGGTVEGVDGTDVADLTRAEGEAREQMMSELAFLRKHIPGFKKAKIEASSVSIGVRDTRHVIGVSTLTGADILERRSFPDEVAFNMKGGVPVNGIPYGCLVPQATEGLLMAGNCISVIPGSTSMGSQLGSFNNLKDIPSMWTTGEAAGTAAALAVDAGVSPRNLDVQTLRAQLFRQGAMFTPERVRELEAVQLPSGRTIRQYYDDELTSMKDHWRRMGAWS